MNHSCDVEIVVLDGSTVLSHSTRALEHLPAPGDRWSLEREGDELASWCQASGEVTQVALRGPGRARVEVQVRPLRSLAERPVVILNENRIPEALRNAAAKALLRHPSAPFVRWQASVEPRTVLQLLGPDRGAGLALHDCEVILDKAFAEEPSVA